MKALGIRASHSITRLKLRSRGERPIRRCSWRDQLYLSLTVCRLKATREPFSVQLICIVCTTKCKEFNHKRTVRTQRNRFNSWSHLLLGTFRSRECVRLKHEQLWSDRDRPHDSHQTFGKSRDRQICNEKVNRGGWGREKRFPSSLTIPFLRWWLYSFFERRYLLNVLNLGFGEVTSFWVETNDFIFNDSYKAFNTTVTSMTIKNCYKFTLKNQNNN